MDYLDIFVLIIVVATVSEAQQEGIFVPPNWPRTQQIQQQFIQPQIDYQGEVLLEDLQNTFYQNRPKFLPYERQTDATETFADYESNEKDLHPENSPYHHTVRNVHQQARSLSLRKTSFQPLCPTNHTVVWFSDPKYEYIPNHYDTYICSHAYDFSDVTNQRDHNKEHNKQMCGLFKFVCMQKTKQIFLTRRPIDGGDCWETESVHVPDGCDCQWPEHLFFGMKPHP